MRLKRYQHSVTRKNKGSANRNEQLESGRAVAGVLRVYMKDGTVQEIVFGDSEEQRSRVLAQLRAGLARSMH